MTAILFIALCAATVWMGYHHTRRLMQELTNALEIILYDDPDPTDAAAPHRPPAPHPEAD